MISQRFSTQIVERGGSAGIVVPFDPDALWGEKARHDVSGTIADHPVRGPLTRDRDGWWLSLGPAWRRDSGLSAGADVEVALAPEGPQLENVAADLAAALNDHPAALSFFFSLAPFYRKNFVRWIESAKHPETRAARIAETVKLLSEGKRQK
jgi:hypothetical protein